MNEKVFSGILSALLAFLALICVYYGTSFAPVPRRYLQPGAIDPFDIVAEASSPFSTGAGTIKSFPVCDMRLSEFIPCLDKKLARQLKLKLNYKFREHYERHCPPAERRYNCLIPPPADYKIPVRWPASRDVVWRANVPHTRLAYAKSDQKWMVVNGDKINFPGGGTHFHNGAEKYIAGLAKMLKFPDDNLSNNGSIRNALDVGCGVASFGAYLLPTNIIAMSIAPNDVHENQVQFALERGIPAALGVLGTKRLPYPSRSFDLVHCSRCRVDWLQRDGILLLELDRLLRPGGYFVLSSTEVYAQDEGSRRIWAAMSDLLKRMCWKVATRRDQTAIWVKPTNNGCYVRRPPGTQPPFCDSNEDPDAAWNVPMKPCITTHLTTKVSKLAPWPQRLTAASPHFEELGISQEKYIKDTETWNYRVIHYWKEMEKRIGRNSFRNIMDMNANIGGFAASLADKDVWVMNVVPVNESNKLKIIYDRGLIGTFHNWCESFSTYPRTYDLLHAWLIFSEMENGDCSVEDLLIEMDRMLRPHGFVIVRDKPLVIKNVMKLLNALRWEGWYSTPNGDFLSSSEESVLIARKKLWKDGS